MHTRMNLTGLADFANAQLANSGQALRLALDDILLDPGNPRTAADENSAAAIEAQEALDADVAERGIKTPISVRPHPTLPGKYFINYGQRRYKSACRNKLRTIPAFIDEKFDSYDQVNENELRRGLTTRALALFIKGRLDAGDSKSEIAERLRKKNQTFITEHLALIDAPDCVNDAYAAGVTSARTLYDLRQAWQAFPTEIDEWCREQTHINRDSIREALAAFRHDEASAAFDAQANPSPLQRKILGHGEKAGVVALNDDKNAAALRAHSMSQELDATEQTPERASDVQAASTDRIAVKYKGRWASISQDVVVPIVLDGSSEVLNVPLSGLVFKR
jgi:ParB family chromosome partitioning protein